MRNIFKIRITEIILMLGITAITIIWNPPFQLLDISFLLIMTMRSICIKLEDASRGASE